LLILIKPDGRHDFDWRRIYFAVLHKEEPRAFVLCFPNNGATGPNDFAEFTGGALNTIWTGKILIRKMSNFSRDSFLFN
jgi:hypothetical protein